MVLPLAHLRLIYEQLFQDGVIVAKKDKRPQSMHPDVREVSNLQVICAMASLKSKGFVRETFAWKHAYYYVTNEGTAYLRDYLHLPSEIVPASLQRVRRPAPSARVRRVEGHTPHILKPNVTERHISYRMGTGEGRISRDSNVSVDQPGVRTQTFLKRHEDFCRGGKCLAKQGNEKSSVKDAKLPVSFVPPTSVVKKVSKAMPKVHTASCASIKEVRTLYRKMTSINPPAAFKESECVKMQEATMKETREDSSNPALEVVTKTKIPKSDPDHDSATLAPTATGDIKDLKEKNVVDLHIADIQKVMEGLIPLKPISECHVEAGCPGPVVSSGDPDAALETTLQDVQRSDLLKGLSLSWFFFFSLVCSRGHLGVAMGTASVWLLYRGII